MMTMLVCFASSLTNQHCLNGARGTPASWPRLSEGRHSGNLFQCGSHFQMKNEKLGLVGKLLNTAAPRLTSFNKKMLAANSANQGSSVTFEQNQVPKPRPQNRQFYCHAWEYAHSNPPEHAQVHRNVLLGCARANQIPLQI